MSSRGAPCEGSASAGACALSAARAARRSMRGVSRARAACTAKGSSPSSRTAAVAGPVAASCRAAAAAARGPRPRARAAAPRATGWCGPPGSAAARASSPRCGWTARAARSSCRPSLREVARRAGEGVRASNSVRTHPEERRLPQDEVGEFARLDGTHLAPQPVDDRGHDRVLGDITAGAVVVRPAVARQGAAQFLHDVRGLPGPPHHLTESSHGLGVGGHRGDRAHVLENVLGRHGRRPHPAFGEGEFGRDTRVQVMGDETDVQLFVGGVHREGPGGGGGGRQNVRFPHDPDDVRGVTATGTLRVEGVEGAAGDRAQQVLDEPGLVEGVAVDRHLDPAGVGDA